MVTPREDSTKRSIKTKRRLTGGDEGVPHEGGLVGIVANTINYIWRADSASSTGLVHEPGSPCGLAQQGLGNYVGETDRAGSKCGTSES